MNKFRFGEIYMSFTVRSLLTRLQESICIRYPSASERKRKWRRERWIQREKWGEKGRGGRESRVGTFMHETDAQARHLDVWQVPQPLKQRGGCPGLQQIAFDSRSSKRAHVLARALVRALSRTESHRSPATTSPHSTPSVTSFCRAHCSIASIPLKFCTVCGVRYFCFGWPY